MLRVIGIDPGTVTIDACGLEDGRMFLDRSVPTAEALAGPARCVGLLEAAVPVDCIAGPSGYGLPLTRVQEATEEDLRLAFLAAEGEPGGIGGLRALARALARSALPVFFTPGVIHLPSVPAHRKVNRVDMGTAEKVCAAALAIDEQARRTGRSVREVSFVLLELGGAFTAALAVADGQIVDGVGWRGCAGASRKASGASPRCACWTGSRRKRRKARRAPPSSRTGCAAGRTANSSRRSASARRGGRYSTISTSFRVTKRGGASASRDGDPRAHRRRFDAWVRRIGRAGGVSRRRRGRLRRSRSARLGGDGLGRAAEGGDSLQRGRGAAGCARRLA